ncbi:hypothetical protein LAC81_26070 [Ensifer adhaerens]|uniref:hypothetical protein n=1 Tax=Ensifer adhaerens TaxID=106592 RepID=UPI001CBED18B|nr:hypothetical protein [Ensifer adhaerens]MBZ7924192.1 hypothetical protein [Ensifer adhaerens]UAX96551.1 hypothetical protein LAC78_22415 [Ensifer adhaerens]UAY04105.1 hypothetical protein LAC80_22545 [Ensifer adhaerens]UAY12091.1 hypothetical protein LAC81_26070 [Ensifer adhaerens]
MKQKRNFIVEHKNSRKRRFVRPTSIWGDTDLKSLAREFEASTAVHVGPFVESTAPTFETSSGPGVVEDHSLNELASKMVDAPLEDCLEETQRADLLASPQDISVVAPRRAPNKRRPKRGPAPVQNSESSAGFPSSAGDELEFLEAENLALKQKLTKRLRADNELLKLMLERLASRSGIGSV